MKKVLIVYDMKDVRVLMKDLLESNDYDVVEAESGKQALAVLKRDKDVKLVLLDIMMTDMDGLQTAHEIRKICNVPIIVVSVKDDDTTKKMAKKLYGIHYYITKPFPNKQLIDTIKTVVGSK